MGDFTVQTLVSGRSGIVNGVASMMPKIVVQVWNLWAEGKMEEAMKLQEVVSRWLWLLEKPSAPETKAALQRLFGHGGSARRPLRSFGDAEAESLAEKMKDVTNIEIHL